MGRPAYVDLDDTLIASILDRRGRVAEIIVRPGVDDFLRSLSKYGDPYLLTHATVPHVEEAFRAMGRASRMFHGVISREVMAPVIEQIDLINAEVGRRKDRLALYAEIPPIAPSGAIFDDQDVGSELYYIKTLSVGASERHWIRVRPFVRLEGAARDLREAYEEFKRRFSRVVMSGRARRVV